MKDPYVLEDGTLRNKLGITDYQELKAAERDIGYVKLLDAESVIKSKCDITLLKNIHKHIFEDIFDWAGEFRTVPVYKEEVVIPGISLEYAAPKDINKQLTQYLDEMNSANWQNMNIDDLTKQFVSYLAKIWRVHPFRDGNTRTTLTFANIFAREHGFEMDMSTMLDDLGRVVDSNTGRVTRWSIRDKFVLASLDENCYPEPQALEQIIKQAINNGVKKKIDSLSEILER